MHVSSPVNGAGSDGFYGAGFDVGVCIYGLKWVALPNGWRQGGFNVNTGRGGLELVIFLVEFIRPRRYLG